MNEGRQIAQLTKVHHADDRRRVGGADARRAARPRPRRPARRASPKPWSTREDPDRRRAAAAHGHRVPPATREARAHVGARRSVSSPSPAGAADYGRSPTWSPSRCRARSATCCVDACGRSTARTPTSRRRCRPPRTAHPVEPHDQRAPAVRLHVARARGRQAHPPGVRVHVQRRGDGAVLRHAAPLPARPRLPPRREPDRDGAGQRARGPVDRRRRHLPEPGLGTARRPGHHRSRPGGPAGPGDRVDGRRQAGLPGDPRRGAAGLHPVRPTGGGGTRDAHGVTAEDRRPAQPAVQPDHLERARAGAHRSTRPVPSCSTSTRCRRSPTGRG